MWTETGWAITDGYAGNRRQTEALAERLATSARHCLIRPWGPCRWFAPRLLPGAGHALGTAFSELLAQPPALAIGCGRQAAAATRWLRRAGSRTIQILDPRLDPSHWDLVVVPMHDPLRGSNVVTLLGSLNPVDDPWLEQARRQFAGFAQFPSPRIAFLVGGPSRHAPWTDGDFETTLVGLETRLRQQRGSILATISRRTPHSIQRRLNDRLRHYPGLLWRAGDHAVNPYPGLLAWADRIVCTPDSVNMLSEACATRVPVYVAHPQKTQGRLRAFIDALHARDRIRADDGTAEPFAVEPLRETARVAELIQRKLMSLPRPDIAE
ncbi:MAG: mitochondrial fission ELM1 family protein [Xanthomonadaceae bacterium]|jgi:mitochondrial fission protein ELM1|nr:mitochondrial fission ELM1 family protein [Xanthomonadaceae bacterium]